MGGHRTGIEVCWFVCLCVTCESTHLDAIALHFQHGYSLQTIVLNVTDFDVKTLLSYKSSQKLRSLN